MSNYLAKTYGCICGYKYTYPDTRELEIGIYSDYYCFKMNGVTLPGHCASCKVDKLGIVLDESEIAQLFVKTEDDVLSEVIEIITQDSNGVPQTIKRPLNDAEIEQEMESISKAHQMNDESSFDASTAYDAYVPTGESGVLIASLPNESQPEADPEAV